MLCVCVGMSVCVCVRVCISVFVCEDFNPISKLEAPSSLCEDEENIDRHDAKELLQRFFPSRWTVVTDVDQDVHRTL